MKTTTLKFPSGEFTHTELAAFNNKTNQQVWQAYAEARKTGQIIAAPVPERKNDGKGKPSLVWVVNPNYVAPVVVVTAPADGTTAATIPPAVAPVAVDPAVAAKEAADKKAAKDAARLTKQAEKEAAKALKAKEKADKKAAKLAEKAAAAAAALANAQPVTVAAAAPAAEPVTTVEVKPTEIVSVPAASAPAIELNPSTPALEPAAPATAPVAETPVFVVNAVTATAPAATGDKPVTVNGQPIAEIRDTTFACPVCQGKILAGNTANGVMVWCPAGPDTCKSAENPFGHGNNEKAAFEILTAKWGFAMAGSR